jgi:hypothetical protein
MSDINKINNEIDLLSEAIKSMKKKFEDSKSFGFKNKNGRLDPITISLALVSLFVAIFLVFSIASIRIVLEPSFRFVGHEAPVVNSSDLEAGGNLVIELEFESDNLPGKTDIFGQFVCGDGYNKTSDQYTDYFINLGGSDPFRAQILWPVPIPEDIPVGVECQYLHAAVLTNGAVQTTSAVFTIKEGRK